MAEQRRRWSPEFKRDAVNLVRSSGRPVAEIARELGVGESSLAYWLEKDRKANPATGYYLPGTNKSVGFRTATCLGLSDGRLSWDGPPVTHPDPSAVELTPRSGLRLGPTGNGRVEWRRIGFSLFRIRCPVAFPSPKKRAQTFFPISGKTHLLKDDFAYAKLTFEAL